MDKDLVAKLRTPMHTWISQRNDNRTLTEDSIQYGLMFQEIQEPLAVGIKYFGMRKNMKIMENKNLREPIMIEKAELLLLSST